MPTLLEVRQRVMETLDEVISQQAVQPVRVWLIAQKTGLPKLLPYGYFGIGQQPLNDYVGQSSPFPQFKMSAEEQLNRFNRLSLLANTDSAATLAVLLDGLSYLTLMAHPTRPMLRIDLRSETGWLRVEQALDRILRMVHQPVTEKRSQTGLDAVVQRGPADRGQT